MSFRNKLKLLRVSIKLPTSRQEPSACSALHFLSQPPLFSGPQQHSPVPPGLLSGPQSCAHGAVHKSHSVSLVRIDPFTGFGPLHISSLPSHSLCICEPESSLVPGAQWYAAHGGGHEKKALLIFQRRGTALSYVGPAPWLLYGQAISDLILRSILNVSVH